MHFMGGGIDEVVADQEGGFRSTEGRRWRSLTTAEPYVETQRSSVVGEDDKVPTRSPWVDRDEEVLEFVRDFL